MIAAKFSHLPRSKAVPEEVHAFAKRLVDQLNGPQPDAVAKYGVYADDAAAGAAGVKVGEGYRKSDGTVRWRVS